MSNIDDSVLGDLVFFTVLRKCTPEEAQELEELAGVALAKNGEESDKADTELQKRVLEILKREEVPG